MPPRAWFITGVSSGFGRHLAEQLLERGDRVVGTVRDPSKIADLITRSPDAFHVVTLDLRDAAAVRGVVDRAFADLGRIDVVISNAGYRRSGRRKKKLTDQQIQDIVATNLVGPIQLIRAALPHLRAQSGGRLIQISSYGGQVAFAGNALYQRSVRFRLDARTTGARSRTARRSGSQRRRLIPSSLERSSTFPKDQTKRVYARH